MFASTARLANSVLRNAYRPVGVPPREYCSTLRRLLACGCGGIPLGSAFPPRRVLKILPRTDAANEGQPLKKRDQVPRDKTAHPPHKPSYNPILVQIQWPPCHQMGGRNRGLRKPLAIPRNRFLKSKGSYGSPNGGTFWILNGCGFFSQVRLQIPALLARCQKVEN